MAVVMWKQHRDLSGGNIINFIDFGLMNLDYVQTAKLGMRKC